MEKRFILKINDISGFTFFKSYYESICYLEPEDKKEMLEAIVDFIFLDKEPDFDGFKASIWVIIKPNLTSSKNKSSKYQEKMKSKSKRNQNKTKSKSNSNDNELTDEPNSDEPSPRIKDKDKNKKENKKKEKEEEDGVLGTTPTLYTYLESQFGRTISPIEIETLDNWRNDFTDDIIEHAIYVAVINNKKKMSYVNGVLRNWKSCGYKTLTEIEEEEDSHYSRSTDECMENKEIFDYDWLNGDEDDY